MLLLSFSFKSLNNFLASSISTSRSCSFFSSNSFMNFSKLDLLLHNSFPPF